MVVQYVRKNILLQAMAITGGCQTDEILVFIFNLKKHRGEGTWG